MGEERFTGFALLNIYWIIIIDVYDIITRYRKRNTEFCHINIIKIATSIMILFNNNLLFFTRRKFIFIYSEQLEPLNFICGFTLGHDL